MGVGRRSRSHPARTRVGAVTVGVGAVVLFGVLTAAPARAITWPTTWNSIGVCAESEPVGDESPTQVDLVGSATFSAAYFSVDSNYLYLRARVGGSPAGPGMFAGSDWVVLLQTVGGDPFEYQWLINLDGKSEEVGLWSNDPSTATHISFSPIFNDPAETKVFSDTT